MLINSILLALSSSLDSLGIGITYGIKNMKISKISRLILFTISCFVSFSSILLGNFINNFISNSFANLIGCSVLVFIGVSMIFKSISNSNNVKNNYYDFNNSNLIDPRESIALGFALSLDSLGIGISYSLTDSTSFLFPIFIGIFQVVFLNSGIFISKKIKNISNIPDFVCSLISGMLLILFGIFRLFYCKTVCCIST